MASHWGMWNEFVPGSNKPKKILARKDGYEVYQYVLLSSKTVTDYKQLLAIQEEK